MSEYKCRIATEMDIEELLVMLHEYHKQSPYKNIPWDIDSVSSSLFEMLDEGIIVVAEDSLGYISGCLGCLFSPIPFNDNYVMCVGRFHYVCPEDRGYGVGALLLDYVENNAEEFADIKNIVLGTNKSSPIYLDKHLKKRGYLPLETLYTREV